MRTILILAALATSAIAQTSGIGAALPQPVPQFFDNIGRPAAGAKLCTFQAGSSTPQATWQDSNLVTQNTNPILLNSAGRPTAMNGSLVGIWLNNSSYKLVLLLGGDGTCSTGTTLWSQDNVTAPIAAIMGGVVNVLSYGARCDGSTDDAAAFAAALAAGANVIVPGNRICIIGSALTMNTSSQSFQCDDGVIIRAKTGFTGTLFTLSGSSDNIVQNCAWDGNGQGSNGGSIITITNPNRLYFRGNKLSGTVAGQYALHGSGVTYSRISDNTFVTGGNSILLQEGTNYSVIEGNRIDEVSGTGSSTLSGSAIGLQTGAPGGTLHDVTVTGNSVREKYHFCGEAGMFAGGAADTTLVYNIAFVGNTCQIANSTGTGNCGAANGEACGGFSLSIVSNSLVNSNTYYASGQNVNIGAIELVKCKGCQAVGNTIIMDTAGVIGQGSEAISANCWGCVISANKIFGMSTGATGFVGAIDVHTISGFNQIDDTVVSGNQITLPSGIVANTGGIYVNCNNHTGATNSLSRLTITGNTIVGPDNSHGRGIWVADNDALCALDAINIVGNTVSSLLVGIQHSTGETNALITGNQYSNNGTNQGSAATSYAPNFNPGLMSFGKTSAPSYPVDVAGDIALTGILRNSGSTQVTGGVHIGGQAAPTNFLDVVGTAAITGQTCFSPNLTCNTGTPGTSSPIVEWDAPSNARYRIDIVSGSPYKIEHNSVDSAKFSFQFSNQERFYLDPNNGGSGGFVPAGGWTFFLGAGLVGAGPTCSAGNFQGSLKVFTDSNTATWGAAIAGGGANVVLGFCDGSSGWTVAGK